jgi:hypothetical protein
MVPMIVPMIMIVIVPMIMIVIVPMIIIVIVPMIMIVIVPMMLPSERRYWKQPGSRYCANNRELANHRCLQLGFWLVPRLKDADANEFTNGKE